MTIVLDVRTGIKVDETRLRTPEGISLRFKTWILCDFEKLLALEFFMMFKTYITRTLKKTRVGKRELEREFHEL